MQSPRPRSNGSPNGCSTRSTRITIVSEERHEIGKAAEASTHQVRIEIAATGAEMDLGVRERLEERLLERADYWARTCIAERHAES